jgi:glycosyltransferase involved in cell wall biosynthesis
MAGPAQLWVIVPAFNEGPAIAGVVGALRERDYEVVVIDDGSADDTSIAAARAGATVLRHPFNLGQGAALQTGIMFALARGATEIVTFDADGQHDPDDIATLRTVREHSGCDVVLGSRFLGSAPGMPASRRILLRFAATWTRLVHGLDLTDAHNGLRLLSRHAAERLRITHNRMAHASEIVAQIGTLGLRWAEAPVHVSYTAYSLRKGQRNGDALHIAIDLLAGRLFR